MGALTEAQPITLPVPTSGMSTRQPLASMGLSYSPWILNHEGRTSSMAVRNGYVVHSVVSSNVSCFSMGVWGPKSSSGSNKLYVYVQDAANNKIYDVSAAAESLVFTCANNIADECYAFNFAGRLGFTVEASYANDAVGFDGTTWAVLGFSVLTARVGISFKRRVYLFSGTTLYYSAFDGVTGSVTTRDLATVFSGSGPIAWAAALSSPGERSAESYLAIGNSEGEILVYMGSYPDAPNWELIGKYQTSPPLGYNSIINYRNDTWILTETGVVSLRDLITLGAKANSEESPSFEIADYWTKLVAAVQAATPNIWNGYPISGAYWPERNQIRVLFPGYLDESDTFHSDMASILCYNIISKSWTVHSLDNVDTSALGGLTYYRNNLYFFTRNVIMKVSSGYKDEQWDNPGTYAAYDTSLQGAYTDYGSSRRLKTVVGVQPVIKTDFNGIYVTMEVVADMRLSASDPASVELIDGYNSPYYSVGVQGSYIHYRMEGTSDVASTDGLEVFSITTYLREGGRG